MRFRSRDKPHKPAKVGAAPTRRVRARELGIDALCWIAYLTRVSVGYAVRFARALTLTYSRDLLVVRRVHMQPIRVRRAVNLPPEQCLTLLEAYQRPEVVAVLTSVPTDPPRDLQCLLDVYHATLEAGFVSLEVWARGRTLPAALTAIWKADVAQRKRSL